MKLLHPICPHITEELWSKQGNKSFLSLESWPKYDSKKIDVTIEYAEALIENLRSDIRYLVNLLKLEKPKSITIIISQKWKYELFKEFKKIFETTKNFSDIMKLLMPNFKQHGQEVSKILPKLIEKKPELIIAQEKELSIIKSNLDKIEKEFICKIQIEDGDKFKHPKSNFALPGKTAIILE